MGCGGNSAEIGAWPEDGVGLGLRSPNVGVLGCAWAGCGEATRTGLLTEVVGYPGAKACPGASSSPVSQTDGVETLQLSRAAPILGASWTSGFPLPPPPPSPPSSGFGSVPSSLGVLNPKTFRSLPFVVPMPTGDDQLECCAERTGGACRTLEVICPPPIVGPAKVLPSDSEVQAATDLSLQLEWEDFGSDTHKIELVRTAWAILFYNTDVIEWLMCHGTLGHANQCVVEKIRGLGNRDLVRVREDQRSSWCGQRECWEYSKCCDYMIAFPGLGGGRIFICTESSRWRSAVTFWSMDDRAVKTCTAIHLAADLLHEALHTCGRAGGDNPDHCRLSCLVQNNMLWALLHRYPAAWSAASCGAALETGDDLWYKDDGVSFGQHREDE